MQSVTKNGTRVLAILLAFLAAAPIDSVDGAEARKRWDLMNQMRRDKFDLVLPEVMRENGVDMWITVNREGYEDPLTPDFGRGYVGDWGYYVFTDRGGERIERAALGIGTHLLEENGAYDLVTDDFDLAEFVRERDPGAIALN
jgi:hypothetical protein